MTNSNATQKKLFPSNKHVHLDSFLEKQFQLFQKLEEEIDITHLVRYENLVNFKAAAMSPVQRWFSYREGYSSEIVEDFIKENNISGLVFDPFCGSGSTLLAARQSNLPSVGIDINPYSTLIANVSNQKYEAEDKSVLNDCITRFKNIEYDKSDRKINFNLINKIFNDDILNSLFVIRDQIDKISNKNINRLLFATWLSILEEVSNIKKEGNGIKYLFTKRTKDGYVNLDQEKWENEYFPEDKFKFVRNIFVKKLEIIYDDILKSYGKIDHESTILNGNCLDTDFHNYDEFELTYFSPPYCNAFDYFEIHKVELWMGEFVQNRGDLLDLKRAGFRSNTTSLSDKDISYSNEAITNIVSLLQSRDLWDKRLPDVVSGYFDDMHTLLEKTYKQTSKGGYVAIVVGNSAYAGCIIPTDLLIADLGKRLGFKLNTIAKVRHLTTSSQQKKYLEPLKQYLRESIVVFKK